MVPYDYRVWTSNHVWLEKGPVPLWTIACALRVFGTDEFVVRLPSMMLSLLSVYLTYLIAALLFDKQPAILAAFIHSINGLLIMVAAGRMSSDHVDAFFVFFVELGVWLLLVQIMKKAQQIHVSLLIGVLIGAAVLCKWSPALVVFPIWISGYLLSGQRSVRRLLPALAFSTVGCVLVAGPYLAYIHATYPQEAAWVIRKYLLAYSDPVDAHSGPAYIYLQMMGVVFGELIYVPLFLGMYHIATRKADWRVGVLTVWWMLPTLVFSLAATKRATYLLISAPAFFVLLAHYWFHIKQRWTGSGPRWTVYSLLILLVGLPVRYTMDRITPFKRLERSPAWSQEAKLLKQRIGASENVVVFNVEHNIEAMFYSGLTIYDYVPDDATIRRVIAGGDSVIINDDGTGRITVGPLDHVKVLRLMRATTGQARTDDRSPETQ